MLGAEMRGTGALKETLACFCGIFSAVTRNLGGFSTLKKKGIGKF